MKEPLTIATAASAAGVTVGAGHVAGMPIDALVYGLFGGIVAVLAVPSRNERPAGGLALYMALAGSMVVSVLVAAALGPVSAALLQFDRVDDLLELRAMSFLWAAGAQAGLLVTVIEAVRRRIEQLGGIAPHEPEGRPK